MSQVQRTFFCSEPTIEILEKGVIYVPSYQSRRRSGVFFFDLEHILHRFLVFRLLNLSMYLFAGCNLQISGQITNKQNLLYNRAIL